MLALVFALLFSYWAWVRYNGYAGNLIIEFNGSLWTLFWEALCYVAVGVLGMIGILSRRNFNIFLARCCYITFRILGKMAQIIGVLNHCSFFRDGGFHSTQRATHEH